MIKRDGILITKFEVLNMDCKELQELFDNISDSERLELLTSLSDEEMVIVFKKLNNDLASEVIVDLEKDEAIKVLEELPFDSSVAIINELGENHRNIYLEGHKEVSDKLKALKEDFLLLHPKDVANKIDEMDEVERNQFFNLFTAEELSDFFACLDEEDAARYLQELSDNKASDVLENMYSVDAADILNELEDEDKESYLELMDEDTKDDIETLAKYDEDTVGSIMNTDFISIDASMDVKDAMKILISKAPDVQVINTLFVSDKDKFVGTLDFRKLIITKSPCMIKDIMDEKEKYVDVNDNLEYALKLINDYDIYALPVLDGEKIEGVVTIDDSLEALTSEQEEDYNQLAGLVGEHEEDENVIVKVKRRLPWLATLVCLDLVVCLLISMFEGVISELTVLVLFQPIILGLSGNVGMQSLAVCVRSLSNHELSTNKMKFKHIASELRNGFVLGIIISILAFFACFAFLKITNGGMVNGIDESLKISIIVSVSIVCSLSLSCLFGCLMPIIFNSLHFDPAAASGPFITTLNDVLAITTYFGLAMILLSI